MGTKMRRILCYNSRLSVQTLSVGPPFTQVNVNFCILVLVFRQLAVGALVSTLGACVTVMVMLLVEDAKCTANKVQLHIYI